MKNTDIKRMKVIELHKTEGNVHNVYENVDTIYIDALGRMIVVCKDLSDNTLYTNIVDNDVYRLEVL